MSKSRTISPEKETERRHKIKANNAKYWLGKKRPGLSLKRLGDANPMYGKKVSEETRAKMRASHRQRLQGHIYTDPKSSRTAYVGVHKWVSREFGQPSICEHCNKSNLFAQKIHWANISGDYMRERSDWLRLCVSCHKLYDLARLKK